MKIHVEKWDIKSSGPLSNDALRRKLEEQGFTVSLYSYPPGTYFPAHSHGVDKMDAVLSGKFRLTIDGHSVTLEAGDCITIPKEILHTAEVIDNDPVVSLDGIKEK